MTTGLVPALDPAGLPGPPGLFAFLLLLTFFLHLLFMNLTLGGTILAWVSHLRSGGRRDTPHGVIASRMLGINTFAISLTITTGIAPLLFIQLLYQPLFYSGTILLGWIWFALLILLMAGYYATYLYKFRGAPARGSGGGFWLGASAVAFTLIAMIHVAVHLIHIQPALWPRFAAGPWSVLADPTYWPRLLHFVFAGLGFSGLVIAWWAARQAAAGHEVAVNTAIARTGWRWALWSVVLQVVDGFVLLFLLPSDVMLGIMRGGPATLIPFGLSVVLGIGLLVMLARPIDPVARRGLVGGSLGAMILTVAVMTITRHQVRDLYLEPAYASHSPTVVPQWGTFVLFAVFLVLALVTVAYMVRRALERPAAGEPAA